MSAAAAAARIVVLTRVGCHLCADAVAVVDSVAAELGITWTERDVDAEPEVRAQWSEYVPVVFVDGEVHDWFRVQPDRLRRALTAAGQGPEQR